MEQVENKEKIREVFTEHLPKYRGKNINWENSIGCEVEFIYNDIKGKVKIIKYDKKKLKLIIQYLDKKPFEISTTSFSNGHLGGLLKPQNKKYSFQIGETVNTKKSKLKILERTRIQHKSSSEKGYKYECLDCGNIDKISEYNLLQNQGCNICCNSARKVVKGINDIATTHPQYVKYFVNIEDAYKYSYGYNGNVLLKCPDCGNEKIIKLNTLTTYGFGCSKCGDGKSYNEKFMINLFEQLGIDFETEYSPDWIKPKRFDFYFKLNNKGYIVEMDGGLGHGKGIHSLSKQTSKETKGIDDYKDGLAQEHCIEVIRVNCDKSELEYIKNNIIIKLGKMFNLSNIDWLKCEEFALSSLVKLICDIWNNKIKNTTSISKFIKLSLPTIIKYLKQGNKLGWCDYNAKEEVIKNTIKMGKMNAKQVVVFKNNKSLGIFPSTIYLEKNSEKLFGVKLNHRNISMVCNNKRNHHKGLTFKYI